MSDKESELYEKGVIPKKEELKSLKNGDWYWQVCFNKPVYETEMKNLCRDREIRFRPTNSRTPTAPPNLNNGT